MLPLDALAEARVVVRDDHRDGRSRTGIARAIGAHLIRGGPYHARNRAPGVYEHEELDTHHNRNSQRPVRARVHRSVPRVYEDS